MRVFAALTVCVALAGCDTVAPFSETRSAPQAAAHPPAQEFRANYGTPAPATRLDGRPEQRTARPVDIDVRSFDAAYQACTQRSRGADASLAMAAARVAADSKETRVVVDMGATAPGKRAAVAFSQCMADKGYVNAR